MIDLLLCANTVAVAGNHLGRRRVFSAFFFWPTIVEVGLSGGESALRALPSRAICAPFARLQASSRASQRPPPPDVDV